MSKRKQSTPKHLIDLTLPVHTTDPPPVPLSSNNSRSHSLRGAALRLVQDSTSSVNLGDSRPPWNTSATPTSHGGLQSGLTSIISRLLRQTSGELDAAPISSAVTAPTPGSDSSHKLTSLIATLLNHTSDDSVIGPKTISSSDSLESLTENVSSDRLTSLISELLQNSSVGDDRGRLKTAYAPASAKAEISVDSTTSASRSAVSPTQGSEDVRKDWGNLLTSLLYDNLIQTQFGPKHLARLSDADRDCISTSPVVFDVTPSDACSSTTRPVSEISQTETSVPKRLTNLISHLLYDIPSDARKRGDPNSLTENSVDSRKLSATEPENNCIINQHPLIISALSGQNTNGDRNVRSSPTHSAPHFTIRSKTKKTLSKLLSCLTASRSIHSDAIFDEGAPTKGDNLPCSSKQTEKEGAGVIQSGVAPVKSEMPDVEDENIDQNIEIPPTSSEGDHQTGHPQNCVVCQEEFCSPPQLRRHIRCKHSTRTTFSCGICKKEFLYRRSLRCHQYMHHNLAFSEPTIDSFKMSMTLKADDPEEYGSAYETTFPGSRSANIAQTIVKSEALSDSSSLSPGNNSDGFVDVTSYSDLSDHAENNEVIPTIKPESGQYFPTSNVCHSSPGLVIHRSHTDGGDQVLNLSLKSQLRSQLLAPKVAADTEALDLSFARDYGKSQNKITSGLTTPINFEGTWKKCPCCSKIFAKPCDLKRHMMMHTGERPFSCHLCSRAFRAKSSMQYHQKARHGLNVELSRGLEQRYRRLKRRAYLAYLNNKTYLPLTNSALLISPDLARDSEAGMERSIDVGMSSPVKTLSRDERFLTGGDTPFGVVGAALLKQHEDPAIVSQSKIFVKSEVLSKLSFGGHGLSSDRGVVSQPLNIREVTHTDTTIAESPGRSQRMGAKKALCNGVEAMRGCEISEEALSNASTISNYLCDEEEAGNVKKLSCDESKQGDSYSTPLRAKDSRISGHLHTVSENGENCRGESVEGINIYGHGGRVFRNTVSNRNGEEKHFRTSENDTGIQGFGNKEIFRVNHTTEASSPRNGEDIVVFEGRKIIVMNEISLARTITGIDQVSGEMVKFYKCGICDKVDKTMDEICCHLCKHCTDSVVYPCPMCSQFFTKVLDLIHHYATHLIARDTGRDPAVESSAMVSSSNDYDDALSGGDKDPDVRAKSESVNDAPSVDDSADKLTDARAGESKRAEMRDTDEIMPRKYMFRQRLKRVALSDKGKLQNGDKKTVGAKTADCFCNVCGNTFTRKYSLRRHKLRHAGQAHYRCIMCGRIFTERRSLRIHMSRAHYEAPPNDPSRKARRLMLLSRLRKITSMRGLSVDNAENYKSGTSGQDGDIERDEGAGDVGEMCQGVSDARGTDVIEIDSSDESGGVVKEESVCGDGTSYTGTIARSPLKHLKVFSKNEKSRRKSSIPMRISNDSKPPSLLQQQLLSPPINYVAPDAKKHPTMDIDDNVKINVAVIKNLLAKQTHESFDYPTDLLLKPIQQKPELTTPENLMPTFSLPSQIVDPRIEYLQNRSLLNFNNHALQSVASQASVMGLPLTVFTSASLTNPSAAPQDLIGIPRVKWEPIATVMAPITSVETEDVYKNLAPQSPDYGLTSEGRKITSLSRTQSRLQQIKTPIDRTQLCKAITSGDGFTKFQCVICNKVFNTHSDINRHMDFHEDIRPYKCGFCEYQARTNSQLKVHMMRHQGIREFCCHLCKYKGVTQSDLNRHMKSQIHKLKVRHECVKCGEGFVSPRSLEKHETRRCQAPIDDLE